MPFIILMATDMKVSGSMTSVMAKGSIIMKTEGGTKVCGSVIKRTAKAYFTFRLETDLKANGKTEFKLVRVRCFIVMVGRRNLRFQKRNEFISTKNTTCPHT